MHDSATRKTHLVLVNGVVFKGNKILVCQRSWQELHQPGKWTIPGGKVERTAGGMFNILEKNLKREIREETGVEIKEKIQLVTDNSFIHSTGHHAVVLIFKCWYKSGHLTDSEETIDCKWVSFEEARKMRFAPNVKKYILEAFKKCIEDKAHLRSIHHPVDN